MPIYQMQMVLSGGARLRGEASWEAARRAGASAVQDTGVLHRNPERSCDHQLIFHMCFLGLLWPKYRIGHHAVNPVTAVSCGRAGCDEVPAAVRRAWAAAVLAAGWPCAA